MKYGIYLGFSLGLMLFAILANYGIGFYFGSIFGILKDDFSFS